MRQVRLREWRHHRALSQADLAKLADVTEATIVRLEKPDHRPARPSTIRKLAQALGIDPHELYATASDDKQEHTP